MENLLADEVVELDHRSSGSLDVSLFWNRASNAVFVQVIDWGAEEDFSFAVEGERARQAFEHPFALMPAAAVQAR